MKILIAGGGTAGHINPALAIAHILKEKYRSCDILFVGTKRGMEKVLVEKAGYPIELITVRGFERKISFNTIKGVFALIKGMIQAKALIKKHRPDLVIGTGGYVSGPVLYWAAKAKIPTFIHEQNAYPGITTRILSKHVDECAISFEESRKYFKQAKKVTLTGNPIRKNLFQIHREQAREKLDLSKDDFLVVVMGGSLGAKSINDACVRMIKNFLGPKDFQLIYAPGKRFYEQVQYDLEEIPKNVDLRDYIHDCDVVYNACDLMVCRSGAITVSEITALGIPSVLIPSPNVAENHQEKNARVLEKENACKVILDQDVNGQTLYDTIIHIKKDKVLQNEMAKNAYQQGIRDADVKIYEIIKKRLGVDFDESDRTGE